MRAFGGKGDGRTLDTDAINKAIDAAAAAGGGTVRFSSGFEKEDLRPAFVLHNVSGADFLNVNAQVSKGASVFQLQNVTISARHIARG